MPNELTAPLPGMAPTGSVTKLLDSFEVDIYGFDDVALDRLPNAEERGLLQGRLRDILTTLRPINYAIADREKAAKALALLFAGYPSLRNASAVDMINAYLAHLDTVPLYAIVRACDDIAHNRIADLDTDFPPTSPRLAKEAQRYVTPIAAEREKIDRILNCRKLMRAPVTPEADARIRAKLTELAASMNMKEAREREVLRAQVRSEQRDWDRRNILAHYRALGVEPVYSGGILVNPSLLERMGKLKGVADGSAIRQKSAKSRATSR